MAQVQSEFRVCLQPGRVKVPFAALFDVSQVHHAQWFSCFDFLLYSLDHRQTQRHAESQLFTTGVQEQISGVGLSRASKPLQSKKAPITVKDCILHHQTAGAARFEGAPLWKSIAIDGTCLGSVAKLRDVLTGGHCY